MNPLRSLITLLAMTSFPLAAQPKMDPELAKLDKDATVDVIVQYRTPPTEGQHGKTSRWGGQLKRRLDLIKGAQYSVTPEALEQLAADPNVAYITPDRPVQAMLDYATPTVYADIARQNGYDGSGITVALIDSGAEARPDLDPASIQKNLHTQTRIVYNQSFVPGEDATDGYGHGTHVAGILAGNGQKSLGTGFTRTFFGVAPNAEIVNLKVLDSSGAGTDSAVIAALQQVVKLKAKYKIRIVNLSLGRPVYESYTKDPLCQAVENAWANGIVVVVAAGNGGRDNSAGTSGYGTIMSPANDPYVITVGAMKTNGTASRADDTMASYSSKGPTLIDHIVKPDLVAPGNRIISLAQGGYLQHNSMPGVNLVDNAYYDPSASGTSLFYFKLSGTSMATPMVSGAAALLLQKDPTLTPDQVKARLMKTASKSFPTSSIVYDASTGMSYTTQYDIFTVGAGYLDVWAALNNTDLALGGAISPTAVNDSANGKVSVVNTDGAVWGGAAVWGSGAVWGGSAVWGSSVWVDGAAAVWGTGAVWGSAAVWGTATPGGTGTANGFGAVWGGGAVWGSSTRPASESLSVILNGEN